MSLLLDALKKAADEKQSRSSPGDEDAGLDAPVPSGVSPAAAQDGELPETARADAVVGIDEPDYAISDAALNLLVSRANSDYRKRRLTWVMLVSTASLLILAAGGGYFMQSMQANVARMEQRHQRNLRQVEAMVQAETPVKPAGTVAGRHPAVRPGDMSRQADRTPPAASRETVTAATPPGPDTDATPHGPRQAPPAARPAAGKAAAVSIEKRRQDDPVESLLNQAWESYRQQRFDVAEQTYRQVLLREPGNRDALLALAAIAAEQNDRQRALAYYREILDRRPDDGDATAGMIALLLDEGGDERQAQRHLQQMLQKHPASPPLNYAMGNLLARQNKWGTAQQRYFNAWVSDKRNPLYCYNLAVSLDRLGKFDQAVTYYRETLRLSASQADFPTDAIETRLRQLAQAGR